MGADNSRSIVLVACETPSETVESTTTCDSNAQRGYEWVKLLMLRSKKNRQQMIYCCFVCCLQFIALVDDILPATASSERRFISAANTSSKEDPRFFLHEQKTGASAPESVQSSRWTRLSDLSAGHCVAITLSIKPTASTTCSIPIRNASTSLPLENVKGHSCGEWAYPALLIVVNNSKRLTRSYSAHLESLEKRSTLTTVLVTSPST